MKITVGAIARKAGYTYKSDSWGRGKPYSYLWVTGVPGTNSHISDAFTRISHAFSDSCWSTNSRCSWMF